MKKNIKHFFLLTALAAGTIHFVNRFINMTADIKNILKAEAIFTIGKTDRFIIPDADQAVRYC